MTSSKIFISNKYTRIYNEIVSRGKSRTTILENKETHHIIPRSFGGSDDEDNLVALTPREHYICHLLLPKMTSGEYRKKMISAFVIMSGKKSYNRTYSSRSYQFFREEYSKINSEYRLGENNPMFGVRRFGEDNPFWGRSHTEKTKQRISEAKKGRSISVPPRSIEHRQKLSVSAKARMNNLTDEQKLAINEKSRKTWESKPIVICPHCGNEGKSGGNMSRYHFDNCKAR